MGAEPMRHIVRMFGTVPNIVSRFCKYMRATMCDDYSSPACNGVTIAKSHIPDQSVSIAEPMSLSGAVRSTISAVHVDLKQKNVETRHDRHDAGAERPFRGKSSAKSVPQLATAQAAQPHRLAKSFPSSLPLSARTSMLR